MGGERDDDDETAPSPPIATEPTATATATATATTAAAAPAAPTTTAPARQKNNPLHGKTLETIVTALLAHYGWDELGRRVNIRCFQENPSVASSLKFLRKTPWARARVESFYLFMEREQRRAGTRPPPE